MTQTIILDEATLDQAVNALDWASIDIFVDDVAHMDIDEIDVDALADTETEGALGYVAWQVVNDYTDRVIHDVLIEAISIAAPEIDGKRISWEVQDEQIARSEIDHYYGYKVMEEVTGGLRAVNRVPSYVDVEYIKFRNAVNAITEDHAENLRVAIDEFAVAMVKRVLNGEDWEIQESDYEDDEN